MIAAFLVGAMVGLLWAYTLDYGLDMIYKEALSDCRKYGLLTQQAAAAKMLLFSALCCIAFTCGSNIVRAILGEGAEPYYLVGLIAVTVGNSVRYAVRIYKRIRDKHDDDDDDKHGGIKIPVPSKA